MNGARPVWILMKFPFIKIPTVLVRSSGSVNNSLQRLILKCMSRLVIWFSYVGRPAERRHGLKLKGWVHGEILLFSCSERNHFLPSDCLSTLNRSMVHALKLFHQIPQRSTVTWNVIISACSDSQWPLFGKQVYSLVVRKKNGSFQMVIMCSLEW